MADQSKKKARGKAKAAKEFHYFTKLPAEIQAMIWNFHRHNAKMQHCFTVTSKGRRLYAAVDNVTWQVVHRYMPRRDTGQTIFPWERKIRFTGIVMFSTYLKPRLEGGGMKVVQDRERNEIIYEASSVHIYADLEYDIFYFDFNYYERFGHRSRDWFRFIRNPVNRQGPIELPSGHWISTIRNVALRAHRYDPIASEGDATVLASMKSLENVYIVVPKTTRVPEPVDMHLTPQVPSAHRMWLIGRGRSIPKGLVHRKRGEMFKFAEDFPPRERSFLQEEGKPIEEGLRAIFTQHGINPRIRVVREDNDQDELRGW